MSIRIDAAGDYITLTAGLPNYNPVTIMFWLRIVTDRNALGVLFSQTNSGGTSFQTIRLNTDGTTLAITSSTGGAATTGTNLSTGTNYFIAYVRDGSNHFAYLGTETTPMALDITRSANTTVTHEVTIGGSDSVNFTNGRIGPIWIYNAAKDSTFIEAQRQTLTTVSTTNLYDFYDTVADVNADFSTNNFTANGSLTFEAQPSPVSADPEGSLVGGKLAGGGLLRHGVLVR